MKPGIRVVVIDEYPLFRDGVAHSLERETGIEVVGRGGTSRDAVQLAGETEPDVMVLDACIVSHTPSLIQDILSRHPATKIIVIAASAKEEEVTHALREGVRGFLLKKASDRELVQTVRALNAGEYYVSPGVAAKLLLRSSPQVTGANKPTERFSELTQREVQILSILVEGRSNKEIGNKLDLSEKTIKHHITNILQKLRVRNRVEAALLASGRPSADTRMLS